jgi:hypothetical protein
MIKTINLPPDIAAAPPTPITNMVLSDIVLSYQTYTYPTSGSGFRRYFTFKLTWEGGDGATSYKYSLNNITTADEFWLRYGEGNLIPSNDQGLSSKTATFDYSSIYGLEPYTYFFCIIAINDAGVVTNRLYYSMPNINNPLTIPHTIAPEPPAPITNLAYSEVTTTGFKLSWSGGDRGTSYTYKTRFKGTATTWANNESNITPLTESLSDKTATFTGLTDGSLFQITITAKNNGGESTSEPLNVVITTEAPSPVFGLGSNPSYMGFVYPSYGRAPPFSLTWSGGDRASSYIYLFRNVGNVDAYDAPYYPPTTDSGVVAKFAYWSPAPQTYRDSFDSQGNNTWITALRIKAKNHIGEVYSDPIMIYNRFGLQY